MYLSDLVGRIVSVKGNPKGVCLGIGISLKSYALKYLFCANEKSKSTPSFAVAFSSVEVLDEAIHLSALRPVYPKNCARLFPGTPIYSPSGENLGYLSDAEIRNFYLETLFSDDSASYSITAVSACSDAIILKKEQPYPIGQRIPAHAISIGEGKSGIVTKPVLKKALQKGALIRFTLSLPPFSLFETLK
jgi:hypothetical protein